MCFVVCLTHAGTLSSYAYVILVIFYLQQRQIPVLPVLQQIGRPAVVPDADIVNGFDCYFCRDMDAIRALVCTDAFVVVVIFGL